MSDPSTDASRSIDFDRDLCEPSPSGDYRAVYAMMGVPSPSDSDDETRGWE